MVTEQAQLVSYDLAPSGLPGDPDDPEPDAATGWAVSIIKPDRRGWEDYYAWGEAAFALAEEIETTEGLTTQAVAAYHEAGAAFNNVVFTCPHDERGRSVIPNDPIMRVKVATSLAKQSQVAGDEFYSDPGSRHIQRGPNMHMIARKTLQTAVRGLIGEDAAASIAGELEAVDPIEAVASAAVQAAQETGTARLVGGLQAVRSDTTERLVTEGEQAIVEFIQVHSLEPDRRGAELIAKTGELILARFGFPRARAGKLALSF